MKKRLALVAILAIALTAVGLMTNGCASLQQPDQTDAEYAAYEAGYAVGDIYILNKGIGNEEVQSALDTLFLIIEQQPDIGGDVLDGLVLYQINRLIPAEEQIRRDLLFVAYRRARLRIEQQLAVDDQVALSVVLDSFKQGLSDSTGIAFSPSVATPTTTDLTALLDAMAADPDNADQEPAPVP